MAGTHVEDLAGRGINYRALDDLFELNAQRSEEVRSRSFNSATGFAIVANAMSGAEGTAANAGCFTWPSQDAAVPCQACLPGQGSNLHHVRQPEQCQDSFCVEPRFKASIFHQISWGLMLIEQPQSKRLRT